MRCTKVRNSHTEHIQNGVQSTNVTIILKKHNKNSAQEPNTQTQHIKDTAQGTNVTNHETEHIQNRA